jgi:hypothetical protein
MKRVSLVFLLILLTMLAFGCSQEQPADPAQKAFARGFVTDGANAPPQYYTGYWTRVGWSIETIDVVHGVGVPHLDDVFLDQYPGKGFTAGLGLTFDVDGSAYIINNWVLGDDPYLAELAKIDLNTGAVTVIAQIENHFSGSEIDACGNMYSVGFQPGPPNEGMYLSQLYGDKLCRIDKYTGEVTPIGDGTGLVDVMDLAFDSKGTLWATTENKLYTLDLETGSATWVADITNVPPAPPGETNPMMVMSIAFDKHDVLYGTAMVGFCAICDPMISPIMQIDTTTGEGTVLGHSELGYNHGGDTMPTEVRIAHRTGSGDFRCLTVSLSALSEHLAHGDYVPGTAGHDCNCGAKGGKAPLDH